MRKQRTSKTCISVIKTQRGKIIMAGDRRVSTTYGTGYTSPVPKIALKDNGMLIGASGNGGGCHILVSGFTPPEFSSGEIINEYMLFNFLPKLRSFLIKQFNWTNKEKDLVIPFGMDVEALIILEKEAYILDIISPEVEEDNGSISIDRVPIPFAIGCGSISALPILHSEESLLGYNSCATLELAMRTAAEISDGCDNYIDYLKI